MKNLVLKKLNQNTVLVTLLNSKLPQSVLIKHLNLSKYSTCKEIIVDTLIRDNLNDNRFIRFTVKNNLVISSSKTNFTNYNIGLIHLANNQLKKYPKELKVSYLTNTQIANILK